jgi:antitoxin (DNA-binding transcriptional repressor) of toxin-antitoxin stability system
MKTFNVREARTHFSDILKLVAGGEEVVLAKAGKPVAIIRAFGTEGKARKAGFFKGKIEIGPEFFEPMEDEFLEYFT